MTTLSQSCYSDLFNRTISGLLSNSSNLKKTNCLVEQHIDSLPVYSFVQTTDWVLSWLIPYTQRFQHHHHRHHRPHRYICAKLNFACSADQSGPWGIRGWCSRVWGLSASAAGSGALLFNLVSTLAVSSLRDMHRNFWTCGGRGTFVSLAAANGTSSCASINLNWTKKSKSTPHTRNSGSSIVSSVSVPSSSTPECYKYTFTCFGKSALNPPISCAISVWFAWIPVAFPRRHPKAPKSNDYLKDGSPRAANWFSSDHLSWRPSQVSL